MRLRQLDLTRFGHFTDQTIDFGPTPVNGSDFHIVFGSNEAGKTTTMEAYLRLLYGFPHKEPYAFKHQRANLQVSGVLDIDGVEHALTRLPKRDANLVDAAGQMVPEALLNSALHSVSLDEYRNLFCLDDETIEAGGEEITKSKGNTGRLLFSAAAGISDLSQVLEDVQARTLEIYRKGGSKSEFAALKRLHEDVSQEIKQQDVGAPAYRGLRVALDQARQTEAALREQKTELSLRKVRLENILAAHPLALEWQGVQNELGPITHFPQALDFDGEQLIDLMKDRIALLSRHEQAAQQIEKLTTRLDDLGEELQVLGIAPRLDALGPLKSRVEAGQLDLPKRETELLQEQADLRAQLNSIGLVASADLARFVLSEMEIAALERARNAVDDAHKDLGTAQTEAKEAREKHHEAARQAQEAAADVTGDDLLEHLIANADADDLLDRYSAAQHDLSAARQNRDAILRKLSRQDVQYDTAPSIPIRHAQAIAINTDLSSAAMTLKGAEQAARLAKARWDAAQTQAEIAQALPDLVSDATASATRAKRDAEWSAHRAAFTSDTADSFESAMRTDDVQTQLRAGQSKELAEYRQAPRLVLETSKEHQSAVEARDLAKATYDELHANFTAQLLACGLPETITADDFAAWVRDVEDATQSQGIYDALLISGDAVLERSENLRNDLSAALEIGDATLRALVRITKARIADRQAQQQVVKIAEGTLRSATAEIARRAHTEEDARAQAQAAITVWRDIVAVHLPDLRADADSWNGLQALHAVRETDTRMRGLRRQILGMTQDSETFAAELDALGIERAGDVDLLDHFADLQRQVLAAQQHQRQINEVGARLAEQQSALTETKQALQVLDAQTQAMAAAFGTQIATSTLEDLRTATGTAQTAIRLRAREKVILQSLLAITDVRTWEEVQTLLGHHPADQATAALSEVIDDLARLDAALDGAIEQRTRAQLDLEAVGDDNAIAVLGARKRTIEAQMEAALLCYLEGRIGHDLAEEAIRRFRDSHRSGMLAATEQAFSDLTNGAYRKLTTHLGAGGDVLMAVQASDGAAKEASAMSKGTRFQLYLSLRAAAYEQMANSRIVLPFFCDDVFETFDEERTRAACQLMQRVGRTGQAIYLTHHRHVVDIAREVCGDQVHLHAL